MRVAGLLRRLRLLFHRDRAMRDLEEEMRLHRDLRAAAPTPGHFGSALRHAEASRDAWGFEALDAVRQDVRYAVRRLRQRPGFALSVIAVLALGIGSTTAMFSAVDAAMLRPLPFAHPEQLVTLTRIGRPFQAAPGSTQSAEPGHPPDLLDVMGMHDAFSHVASYSVGGLDLFDPIHPRHVDVGVVTTDFFATLGVAPVLGSVFPAAAGAPGGPDVAIVSWGLWQRQYGGRAIVGQKIELSGKPYVVVGVMPRGFSFPGQSEVWIPLTVPETRATAHLLHNGLAFSAVIARAATTPAAAATRMMLRWQQTFAVYPHALPGNLVVDRDLIRTHGVEIPLKGSLVADARTPLLILFAATGFLLLIACMNVANLLLSAASQRGHEIAIRQVIGARRIRVIRQLLIECTILSALGGLCGVLVASLTLRLTRVLVPSTLSYLTPVQLDLRVLSFAGITAIITVLAFGILPALSATRIAPGQAMKSATQTSTGSVGRTRAALICAEVALTTTLLIGAGLMVHSFRHVMGADRGMDTHHSGSLQLTFPDSAGRADRERTINAIHRQLLAKSGITEAGFVSDIPLSNERELVVQVGINTSGQSGALSSGWHSARPMMASPGYFTSMGMPLLRGRDFRATDDSGAPPVAIVNETLANRSWPGSDAIGQAVRVVPGGPWITVIGEVGDAREISLDQPAEPQMYFPPGQALFANRDVGLVARGTLSSAQLLAAMQDAVHEVDPGQAVFHVKMMDDVLSASVASHRTNALLTSVFAALAMVLATVGVYAVTAYNAAQRAREFGIRGALGASARRLLILAAREMLIVMAAGLMVGLAAAWVLARLLTTLLYGVTAHDRLTFIGAPLVLIVPAMIATLIPARRAAHVNPADVMRAD